MVAYHQERGAATSSLLTTQQTCTKPLLPKILAFSTADIPNRGGRFPLKKFQIADFCQEFQRTERNNTYVTSSIVRSPFKIVDRARNLVVETLIARLLRIIGLTASIFFHIEIATL